MLRMCQGTYVCQGCVSRDQGNNVAILGTVSVLVVCVCAFLYTGVHTYVRGCVSVLVRYVNVSLKYGVIVGCVRRSLNVRACIMPIKRWLCLNCTIKFKWAASCGEVST